MDANNCLKQLIMDNIVSRKRMSLIDADKDKTYVVEKPIKTYASKNKPR